MVCRAVVRHEGHLQDLCREFRSEDHLRQIQQEAQDTITRVFEKAKV